MSHLLHNNRMAAVIAGGVFLLAAAALMQRVNDGTAVQESADLMLDRQADSAAV
jgi:hypothetical protein